MERIVLAYSGGLDTSVAILYLAETLGAEVIAVTLDLGQGSELNQVRERALAAGAVRAHVLDVCDVFARGFVLPALQAGALYEGQYPRGGARPTPDGAEARGARRDGGRQRHRTRLNGQGQRAGASRSPPCEPSTRPCGSSRPPAAGA